MDQFGILDFRHEKLLSQSSKAPSEDGHPLDLSISKNNNNLDDMTISNFDSCVEYMRPTVITPNLQFTPNRLISQRFRWNHRSHPSIDSDSSFESEQENDYTNSPAWLPVKGVENIDALWYSSTESLKQRVSLTGNELPDFAQTDTEIDSEACDTDSSATISVGIIKELPELTAQVSIDRKTVLELSSCQAEIIDPEDIRSELNRKSGEVGKGEEDDDSDENSLKICETETYLEELLSMQTENEDLSGQIKSSITVGIQERAKKYIKEIRKTKSDMHVPSALNLEVDGSKKQHCVKCNEQFYSVAALLQHLMTHSSRNPGEKLIKCPVCTKRFSTLTTLEVHIHRLHTGEMKYVCQVCEAPYKFSTHLRKHMLTSRCAKGTKKSPQVSP